MQCQAAAPAKQCCCVWPPYLSGCGLHLGGQLVDVPEDGHARVGQGRPAWQLHHHGAPGVLCDVAGVDGQGRQAEDRLPRSIRRKVHHCPHDRASGWSLVWPGAVPQPHACRGTCCLADAALRRRAAPAPVLKG